MWKYLNNKEFLYYLCEIVKSKYISERNYAWHSITCEIYLTHYENYCNDLGLQTHEIYLTYNGNFNPRLQPCDICNDHNRIRLWSCIYKMVNSMQTSTTYSNHTWFFMFELMTSLTTIKEMYVCVHPQICVSYFPL